MRSGEAFRAGQAGVALKGCRPLVFSAVLGRDQPRRKVSRKDWSQQVENRIKKTPSRGDPRGRLKNRQQCLSSRWLEMDRVAFGGEGGLVDHLGHRRMGVDGRVDFLGGEFLVEREAHLGDELGGVLADDVRA